MVRFRAIRCGEVCKRYNFNCGECPEYIEDDITDEHCASYLREPNADKPYKTKDGKYIMVRCDR